MASRERNNVEDIESIKAGKRAFDFLKMNNERNTMRREIKDIKSIFVYDETSLLAKKKIGLEAGIPETVIPMRKYIKNSLKNEYHSTVRILEAITERRRIINE
jgi:hypothetical protein